MDCTVRGSNSDGGRDFPHLSRPALGPTQPTLQWAPGLYWGVESGRGMTLTRHPLLGPWSRNSRAKPLLHLWSLRHKQNLSACTVQLYLYYPYWPYGLYRASVPVQYSYTSTTPIGRTACTEPQCLYRIAIPLLPYRPTACTEPQCLYSIAIPLLPLWAVRFEQSLSACTRVHFAFLYKIR